MSLTSLAVKIAAPLPEIESFDSFLFIGPHPDDIEIGAGATAAKLAEKGKRLTFLICMDGRFGDGFVDGSISADALTELRRNEAISSARALGVEDVRFLELSDGGLYENTELMRGIMKVIGETKPQVIFAPDPCVKSECHSDHLNVGDAARRAAYFAPYPSLCSAWGCGSADVAALAYYMTARPNRYVKLEKKHLKLQSEAIFDCHKTQFPPDSAQGKIIALYLKIRAIDFGLRCFTRHAEGFRVLGTTHMHCLPEAE